MYDPAGSIVEDARSGHLSKRTIIAGESGLVSLFVGVFTIACVDPPFRSKYFSWVERRTL